MIPSPAIVSYGASFTTGSGTAPCAASLPHDSNCFWYMSGFEVTVGGATAGSIKMVTVTGLLGGTVQYAVAVPSGVTTGAFPLVVDFPSGCALPSVDTATDIVVSFPSPGTGSAGVAVVVHGYKGARQLNS